MTRLIGIVMLSYPLKAYTEAEREALADLLSTIAADIKKGQSGGDSFRWELLV